MARLKLPVMATTHRHHQGTEVPIGCQCSICYCGLITYHIYIQGTTSSFTIVYHSINKLPNKLSRTIMIGLDKDEVAQLPHL